MDCIYLDNNATTQPAEEVIAAMERANRDLWANPSSMHRLGQQARQQIELAREQVASLIGAKPQQIIFTSGGTESNNLAIKGLGEPTLYHSSPCPGVLITTPIEHAAVREPAQRFAQGGGKVVYLPVDQQGRVKPEDVARALEKSMWGQNNERMTGGSRRAGIPLTPALPPDIQPPVILISIQWANNETGVIQPIEEIGEVIKAAREKGAKVAAAAAEEDDGRDARPTDARPTDARPTNHLDAGPANFPQIYFHVDGAQAVGKIPVNVAQSDIDLLSFSSHKFHGPKGIGALVVKPGVKLQSVNSGGPQEREKRGGTENSAGIIGFGQAAKRAKEFLKDTAPIAQLTNLRNKFERDILNQAPTASINSAGAKRLWNTSNITFVGLDSEAILLGLSERGVCASAGAACSSGSLEPSPVLMAMGLTEEDSQSSIRFSLSRDTTANQLDSAVALIVETVKRLKKLQQG